MLDRQKAMLKNHSLLQYKYGNCSANPALKPDRYEEVRLKSKHEG